MKSKKIFGAMLCGALVGSIAFAPVSAAADFLQEFSLDARGIESVIDVLRGGSYHQNTDLVPGASGGASAEFDVPDGTSDVVGDLKDETVIDSYTEPSSVFEGEKVVLPDGSDLVKPGYKFAGWSTDPNATEGFFEYVMPAEDTTLYAVWIPDTTQESGVVDSETSGDSSGDSDLEEVNNDSNNGATDGSDDAISGSDDSISGSDDAEGDIEVSPEVNPEGDVLPVVEESYAAEEVSDFVGNSDVDIAE